MNKYYRLAPWGVEIGFCINGDQPEGTICICEHAQLRRLINVESTRHDFNMLVLDNLFI